jgi:fucose 4-O-acetylase-like acetyltransferase
MLFVISGYLFALHDAQPHRIRIKKRVRTLLVPYFLWSGFHLVLLFSMEMEPTLRGWIVDNGINQIDQERHLLHDYHWYEVLGRWLLAPAPYQLWFIRVLFFYNLAYPMLAGWLSQPVGRRAFFAVALLAWLLSVHLYFIESEGLLFFCLGVWMQKSGFNIEQPARWLKPGWWALAAISVALVKSWLAFHGSELLGDAVFPTMLILHKITVFAGLVAAWYGSDALVRVSMAQPWFVWLSAFSFMIYALHAPLVAFCIDPALRLAAPLPEPHLWVFILLPVTLITLSVAVGAAVRRMLPSLYALATGGRGLAS